jgi:hypothetical protein
VSSVSGAAAFVPERSNAREMAGGRSGVQGLSAIPERNSGGQGRGPCDGADRYDRRAAG